MSAADDDLAVVDDLLAEVFGVQLSLARGGLSSSSSFTARVATIDDQVATREGAYSQTHGRDYLIAAADYELSGTAVLPQRGDVLIETVAGESRTYEVLPIAGDAPYVEADPSGAVLLVHAKRIE